MHFNALPECDVRLHKGISAKVKKALQDMMKKNRLGIRQKVHGFQDTGISLQEDIQKMGIHKKPFPKSVKGPFRDIVVFTEA